jgi:hypothetical protein
MKRNLNILIGAILIALIAPMVAQTPSSAIDNYREAVAQPSTPPVINPMDPNYVWGNPLAIDLRNINPVVFQNAAFANERGGILGSSLYTTSINDFLKADEKAGYSSVPKKAAKIGLVATLDETYVPINMFANASLNTSQNETMGLSALR